MIDKVKFVEAFTKLAISKGMNTKHVDYPRKVSIYYQALKRQDFAIEVLGQAIFRDYNFSFPTANELISECRLMKSKKNREIKRIEPPPLPDADVRMYFSEIRNTLSAQREKKEA